MHVSRISKTVKGKTYSNAYLRRTFRDQGKVCHETLAKLSDLSPRAIDQIEATLKGETLISPDGVFAIERGLPHGHVQAILGTIRKLGIARLLSSRSCREQNIILALIAERLIFPSSKLATTRHWHDTTLAGELAVEDVDVDEVYDALDWLLQRQPGIERKLAARHLEEGCFALYDVSSSYYEGHTCPLARRGHGRDGKRGLPIIVYGILADRCGRPVGINVYPGNTGDPSTVPDQADKIRKQFHLERVVLVGDRGMLTEARIESLRKIPGVGWISALRSTAIRKLVHDEAIQMSLFDQRNLAEITTPEFPEERLVVCYNPALAEERRRKREALLQATERLFTRIQKEVERRTKKILKGEEIGLKVGAVKNRYKVAKHFTLTIQDGSFRWSRNEEAISEEAGLDGIYVIRTSEPKERLSAEDAVRNYKNLECIEYAFRTLKGADLRIRPIRHRTEDHVKAHIFLCMLAYYVEWHMREALKPILFDDEELSEVTWTRDPVLPAKSSASARRKKCRRETPDGYPVHDFQTLMKHLATLHRNTCYQKTTGPDSVTFQHEFEH